MSERSKKRDGPVDFEAEGLLDGVEGEDARAARIDLLGQLVEDGVTVEELARAVAEDRLALLPAERILAGEGRYTPAEVAEQAGLELEFLRAHRQAIGLPRLDHDEPVLTDADLEAARILARLLELGLPQKGMLEVGRVLGEGLSRAAQAMRTVVGEAFLRPGDTERDLGLRFAAATRELTPLTGPLLQWGLNVHLRELVRNDVVSRAELASGRMTGARDVAVCFADLVGFTRLGESIDVDELGGIAGRLAEMVADLARPPVRLVKTIGDAAMLVSLEVDPLLDVTLELVAAADAEGEGFPQLRGGVALGAALERGGDWYGRPVNLASRVTGIARRGSVLATAEVRDAAGAGYRWSNAGRHRVRGVKKEITLHRARFQDREGGDAEEESP